MVVLGRIRFLLLQLLSGRSVRPGRSCPSPWYFYTNLPPYIDDDHCLPADGEPAHVIDGPDGLVTAPNVAAAAALKDLVLCWTTDPILIGRLVPSDGTVEVSIEGKSQYDLKASDFDDLLHDGVTNTKTIDYKVVALKMVDAKTIYLRAMHTFADPWNVQRTIYHTYTLKLEGDRYVIRAFGSGKSYAN